jgi:hypothetical protein
MITFVTVQEGQSIWDLAVQVYGSNEGAQALIELNPDVLDFENSPVAGTKLVVDDARIINKDVVRLVKENGVLPNNGTDDWHTGFSNGFNIGFN